MLLPCRKVKVELVGESFIDYYIKEISLPQIQEPVLNKLIGYPEEADLLFSEINPTWIQKYHEHLSELGNDYNTINQNLRCHYKPRDRVSPFYGYYNATILCTINPLKVKKILNWNFGSISQLLETIPKLLWKNR
ncbi:phage integrase SAM-like domain-containing protein [Pseudarcicella hirudinis]